MIGTALPETVDNNDFSLLRYIYFIGQNFVTITIGIFGEWNGATREPRNWGLDDLNMLVNIVRKNMIYKSY